MIILGFGYNVYHVFFFQNEIGVTGFATLDVKQVIKHVILRRCSVTKVPSAVGLAEER